MIFLGRCGAPPGDVTIVGVAGAAACDYLGADLGQRDGGIRGLRGAVDDRGNAVVKDAGSLSPAT